MFLPRKITFKGGISYVFNYTKDLWKKQQNFKRRFKKVLSEEDVSPLTVAIKEFTDILGKNYYQK